MTINVRYLQRPSTSKRRSFTCSGHDGWPYLAVLLILTCMTAMIPVSIFIVRVVQVLPRLSISLQAPSETQTNGMPR
jgi:hypothetical protein